MKATWLLTVALLASACTSEISTSSWGPCPQDPRGSGSGTFDAAGVTMTVDNAPATVEAVPKWTWSHSQGQASSWVDIEVSAPNGYLVMRCYTEAWLATPVANAAKVCSLEGPPATGTIQGSLSSAARSGKVTPSESPVSNDTGAVDLMLDVTATMQEYGHAVQVELHSVVLHLDVKWYAPMPCA